MKYLGAYDSYGHFLEKFYVTNQNGTKRIFKGGGVPEWWEWWLLAMLTINTMVNVTVFFVGRKFKKDR